MDFSAAANWSMGHYQGPDGGHHRGVWAVAQTTYALARPLAVYARYVYYNSLFSQEIPLVPGIPGTLDRQGVRVGLTLAVPLIR
jgi:hypothetical protein